MNFLNNTALLRVAVAIILLMHSIAAIFSNGVHDFGSLSLNKAGFAPMGVPIAWAPTTVGSVISSRVLFYRGVRVTITEAAVTSRIPTLLSLRVHDTTISSQK